MTAVQRLKAKIITLASILLFFLLLIAGFNSKNPARSTGVSVYDIPLSINGWRGRDVRIDDETREILETNAVVMREYRKGDDRVLLAVVHYNNSRVALHLPESCFTGQGSHVVERGRERLGNSCANRFLLEGDKGNKLVLYYFQTGNMITHSYARLRLVMFRNKLLGKEQGCAMVRFSTERQGTLEQDTATLKDFMQQAGEILPDYLP